MDKGHNKTKVKDVKDQVSLGIIRLDYNYEAAPGDIDHPSSFDYDVYYRVVPGFTFEKCMAGDRSPALLQGIDDAIDFLINTKNVNGITGDCGFMMWYQ